MASLLIRNLPPELHARLKASAAANRRSLTQEAILIVEKGLAAANVETFPKPLPEPIRLKGPPPTTEQLLAMIDDGLETRGYSYP